MTITEMHRAFKVELDKVESLQYPTFTNNEIDYFINQAIRKFVKTRYSGLNIKGQGFEETQKRIEDLRTLVREVEVPCTTVDATKPNGYIIQDGFEHINFEVAGEYWLSLGEEVTINIVDGSILKVQGVTEITANTYRYHIDNPFSEHRLHYNTAKPLRLFYNNTIEFISDGSYTVTTAFIRYIKEPIVVSISAATPVDCDLPEIVHEEVVKLAAHEVMEKIEQPRYQTYSNEVMTME